MSLPCLALTEDGKRLAIPLRLAYGVYATVTKILIRYQTIRGYWTDDLLFGVPWLEFGPSTTEVEIEGIIRGQILAVDDVIEIVSNTVQKIGDQIAINTVVKIQDSNGMFLVEIGSLSDAGNYPETWYNLLGVDYALEC